MVVEPVSTPLGIGENTNPESEISFKRNYSI